MILRHVNPKTTFERWAEAHGYNIAPTVPPAANRAYADRDTQAAFDAWNAGAESAARAAAAPAAT